MTTVLDNHMTSIYVSLFCHQVEHDTAQSMQMLLQLDGIKSRMKAASEALQVKYRTTNNERTIRLDNICMQVSLLTAKAIAIDRVNLSRIQNK